MTRIAALPGGLNSDRYADRDSGGAASVCECPDKWPTVRGRGAEAASRRRKRRRRGEHRDVDPRGPRRLSEQPGAAGNPYWLATPAPR
jgi:hypothetical protein